MKSKPSKLTRDGVFAKLLEMHHRSIRQPDDITLTQIRAKLHCGPEKARLYLSNLVESKELEEVMIVDSGGKTFTIWRIL